MNDLSSPAQVQATLEGICRRLAEKANEHEQASAKWFELQPQKERLWCETYVKTPGPAHLRKAEAELAVSKEDWAEVEGRYFALKAKVKALEAQATICQSILKTQTRYA